MKLLTYNFLTSKCVKGVKVGYPLKINIKKTKIESNQPFNQEFVTRILPRLDWGAVRNAAEAVGCEFPAEINIEQPDEEFLKKVHHLLLTIDVIEGELICPETGRVFPINNGIPNMLIGEHEV